MARSRWFAGVDGARGRSVLAFVVEDLFESDGPAVVELDGQALLVPRSLSTHQALRELERAALRSLTALAFPLAEHALHAHLEAAMPNGTAGYVRERLDAAIMWERRMAGSRRALGVVQSRDDAVVALLRASEAPMKVTAVQARLGRGKMPPEVLYFGRATVGLEQHFPDFHEWVRRVTPHCITVMRGDPQRQWSSAELFRALQRRGVELPPKANPWHVVALLRHSPKARYLGRQRFVLAGSRLTRRVYIREAVRQVLEEHRRPMSLQLIVERVNQRVACKTHSVKHVLNVGGYQRTNIGEWRLPPGRRSSRGVR